jgi:hypothetical protein
VLDQRGPRAQHAVTLTVQSWVQIGTGGAGEDPKTPSISLDFLNSAKNTPAQAPDAAWR